MSPVEFCMCKDSNLLTNRVITNTRYFNLHNSAHNKTIFSNVSLEKFRHGISVSHPSRLSIPTRCYKYNIEENI